VFLIDGGGNPFELVTKDGVVVDHWIYYLNL
jgi:hypothetical protein